MKVRAKLDCGNDKRCAAVVEAPKRRNQNKKSPYGNFSLTEKEYILCNYPLATKATDDTLLYKKRGNWIIRKKYNQENSIIPKDFEYFGLSIIFFFSKVHQRHVHMRTSWK